MLRVVAVGKRRRSLFPTCIVTVILRVSGRRSFSTVVLLSIVVVGKRLRSVFLTCIDTFILRVSGRRSYSTLLRVVAVGQRRRSLFLTCIVTVVLRVSGRRSFSSIVLLRVVDVGQRWRSLLPTGDVGLRFDFLLLLIPTISPFPCSVQFCETFQLFCSIFKFPICQVLGLVSFDSGFFPLLS